MLSEAVALDCSRNKRDVDRCNMLGYLCHGIDPYQDPAESDDIWLAPPLQVNFMYKPML